MGTRNGPYNADFPSGTMVRVAARSLLQTFLEDWKFHDPLRPEQVAHADAAATVEKVFYYHGGDELYVLRGIPGVWHEACLRPHKDESEV